MWLQIALLCIFGCTTTLTTSFDLGGIISGNSMAAVPLGRSLGNGEVDVEGICTEPGFACQNCTHAVTCVMIPNGWLKVPLEECPDGLTCNAHEGKCTQTPVPECDTSLKRYEHICEQVGIFPDAHDCRKFHLCSPPEDLPDGAPADHRTGICPRNYGYNPRSAQCSIKLHKGQCTERPVRECTELGESDVMASSPNHYFVCIATPSSLVLKYPSPFYPQIFVCPHGWYYWNKYCIPELPAPVNNPDNNPSVPGNTWEIGPPVENPTFIPPVQENEAPQGHWETGPPVEQDNFVPDVQEKTVNTERTTTKIESFFSTEKTTTYAADTFLADKFDLANYESTDDVAPPVEDFANSFESGFDFW